LKLHGRKVRHEIELEDRSIESVKAGDGSQVRITRQTKIRVIRLSVRSTKLVAVVWPLDTTAARRVVGDGLDLARTENNSGVEADDCHPVSKCTSRPKVASIGNVRDRNTAPNERVYKVGWRHTMVQIAND
jgi:hypothetical protein